MLKSKYLFFITGSIAAFKAAQVVSRLVQEGHEVQVLATPSALKFVGAATFEGLCGKPVLSDLWESGRAMDHIHLSRWADAGIVCPASANTLAQMSLGLASDVVSATLLAWPKTKPLYVFPAMNAEMLSAAPTQSHILALRARGIIVADAGSGSLACGETGEGRLLEPGQILEILGRRPESLHAQRAPAHGLKVLITGGATRENIDGIRYISNVSSGRTAAQLCDEFAAAGWNVTYFHGQHAIQPKSSVTTRPFTDTKCLDHILREELACHYDAVIQCAAVSDYTVAMVNDSVRNENVKLSSEDELLLKLKPTPKILPELKEYSKNKNIRVIGFKLTLNARPGEQVIAAEKILNHGIDAIVANDWSLVSDGKHPGFVLNHDGKHPFDNVTELATILMQISRPKDNV